MPGSSGSTKYEKATTCSVSRGYRERIKLSSARATLRPAWKRRPIIDMLMSSMISVEQVVSCSAW